MTKMTGKERSDLLSVSRKIERVAKQNNKRQAAALEAQLEATLSRIYRPSDDPVWEELAAQAEAAVDKAQQALAERCIELGVQAEFAPRLHVEWYARGQLAMKDRRQELRLLGQAKIEAMRTEADAEIELLMLELQKKIISDGLSTDDAKAFLASMPTPAHLMPLCAVEEMITAKAARPRLERRP